MTSKQERQEGRKRRTRQEIATEDKKEKERQVMQTKKSKRNAVTRAKEVSIRGDK